MIKHRKIHSGDTHNYHIVSRCVGRGFLCRALGNNQYKHQKEWLETKLAELVDIFAIQLYGYSIMSDHYHLVVHVKYPLARQWSDHEVTQRWLKIFKGNPLAQRYARRDPLSHDEWVTLKPYIALWRERLSDIRWFVNVLNECSARSISDDDRHKYQLWEGYYKAKELKHMDELLAAMIYVDLSPIRAQHTDSIYEAYYTSGLQRLRTIRLGRVREKKENPLRFPTLIPLGYESGTEISMCEQRYIELLDYSSQLIMQKGMDKIIESHPLVLTHMKIGRKQWRMLCRNFESPLLQLHGLYNALKGTFKTLGKASLDEQRATKKLWAS